jgi:hypothetical protein
MSRRLVSGAKQRRWRHRNGVTLPRSTRNALELGQRARSVIRVDDRPFVPPEDWHEPADATQSGFRFVVRNPGLGYRHVVTPDEIRSRLRQLPQRWIEPLQVVQLSRMTRKKTTFPCYGLQWGTAIYLYPIEESLVEQFSRPPRPAEYNEARMYGGRWIQRGESWSLVWTEQTIRDFYLNNVLIHELGHLLDDRNSNQRDRERFAEWFAIEHGYRRTRALAANRRRRRRRARRAC